MPPNLSRHPALATLLDRQIQVFPEHAAKLTRLFDLARDDDLAFAERLATIIARMIGDDVDRYCRDYKFLTEIVLEEEIFFRRENRYRLSTFAEAAAAVYHDPLYMTRYMNGLLMSQLWWSNHTAALKFYVDKYLASPDFRSGFRHLEIGPGHGLLLYLASECERSGPLTGWDVSTASVALVRSALSRLGCRRAVSLEHVDLFHAPASTFDSIVFSEVLEHLERPGAALAVLRSLLATGGRVFVHAPVNSPAPDHLTLFRSPEEVVELVKASGLSVEAILFAPATGASLARARQLSLAISTIVVARKDAQ